MLDEKCFALLGDARACVGGLPLNVVIDEFGWYVLVDESFSRYEACAVAVWWVGIVCPGPRRYCKASSTEWLKSSLNAGEVSESKGCLNGVDGPGEYRAGEGTWVRGGLMGY